MPAAKPSALNRRHSTNEEKDQRAAAEAAFSPDTKLPLDPPAQLKGRKVASAVWVRIMGLFNEIDGEVVTAFDADVLIKYCILEEESLVLQGLRDSVLELYEVHAKRLTKLQRSVSAKEMKAYYDALNAVNAFLKRYQGFDARLDGKRKLIHELSKALYLNPRARAGQAPTEKEKPKPKSKMAELLDGKQKAKD